MLRNNSVQLEMFKTDDEASGGQGVSGGNPIHLKKIRGYQKSIYTLVVFILVSLVSFSFGVEKGKKQIAGIMPGMKIEPVSLPRAESTPLAVEASPVSPKPGPVLLVNKNMLFPSRKIGIPTESGQGKGSSTTLTTRKSALLGKTFPVGIGKSAPLGKKTEKINIPAKAAGEESIRINYTIQVASISNSKNVAEELSKLKNKGYTAFSLAKGKYTVICVGRFNAREDAQINLAKMKNSYPDCQIRKL